MPMPINKWNFCKSGNAKFAQHKKKFGHDTESHLYGHLSRSPSTSSIQGILPAIHPKPRPLSAMSSERQFMSATLQDHVRMGSVRSSRAELNDTANDGFLIPSAHIATSSLSNTNDGPKVRTLPSVPISSTENSCANSLSISLPPSATPLSTTASSISSIGHSSDSNMSDACKGVASIASDPISAAPDTASPPHRSGQESHPPPAVNETRPTRPKSPLVPPPWSKPLALISTPEIVPGMVNPATVLHRLFNNPLYSDLALTVNETTFHVHRGILAEQCSYFRRVFEGARSRDPTTEIKKIDCSYTHVLYTHAPKAERDLIETHGEEVDENGIGQPAIAAHESKDTKRATSLQTGEFQSADNGVDDNEKQPDPNTEDEAPHHHCSRKKPYLEPFPDLRSNTRGAILAAGYTAQHFALFLQILYGIQPFSTLKDTDLMPVFRIAHLYELSWLVSLLGKQIFQRLTLSVETWLPILRFAERYQLDTIRRATIDHASQHQVLWTLAVETLSLEDFKAFLRGIHQKDTVSSVKDELLTMFLLVHYQDTTSFSAAAMSSLNTAGSSSSTVHVQQPGRQAALLRRLSRSHSRRKRAVSGSSSAVLKIRQQLHGTAVGSAQGADSLAQHEPNDHLGLVQNTQERRGEDGSIDQSSDDKAEKAKLWMRRFKTECGWEGRISVLD
ncbi:hypothetical protein BGZ59_003291 [Podila verticillata]|nr:hypothetical protein BGZ59_003291 [Podila verticillata]